MYLQKNYHHLWNKKYKSVLVSMCPRQIEFDILGFAHPKLYGTVGSGRLGSFSDHFLAAGSSNVGSSHLLTVSCKLRAGNGQELLGYFLCNSGRNPAARNLLESAKTMPESTQISTDPAAGMIDLG
ncbi:unnamed protein product [Adineta ricciae]|uniref:Uncharacterized protein n=1 Tax=Adineta ricciae TaxID=249248 RepID=A0A816H6Q6_ADIRI|nr:unnamed protein product [Adineta ricciae]